MEELQNELFQIRCDFIKKMAEVETINNEIKALQLKAQQVDAKISEYLTERESEVSDEYNS